MSSTASAPNLGLRKADLLADPITQFQRWFDEAWAAKIDLAHAMTMAVATKDGVPSARMVILRGLDERGFVIYTHATSAKGQILAENPVASLVSFWRELDRQVRIDGTVEPVSQAEADAFFAKRPRSNQLLLWASNQADVVPNRVVLEDRFADLESQYAGQMIPSPPDWGGYRLVPTYFEFWQGRPGYMPDRIRYTRPTSNEWLIERVAP